MATYITDPELKKELRASRETAGTDCYDEVWDRMYVMEPMPNDEHQEVVALLTSVFVEVVQRFGLGEVGPAVNVSDNESDWKVNYRVPDFAVFLNEGRARNLGTHWYGGPDLVVEIVGPNDRSRDKIAFYSDVGVRELMLIERDPWRVELYRHDGRELAMQAGAVVDGETISTCGVPLNLVLSSGESRPRRSFTRKMIEPGRFEKSWPRSRGSQLGQRLTQEELVQVRPVVSARGAMRYGLPSCSIRNSA